MTGSPTIDAFEFARQERHAEGSAPLARMLRLTQGLPEQATGEDGLARWSVQGRKGPHGEPLLELRVQAAPRVVCQRCLGPFAWKVDSETVLQVVGSEAELDDDPQDDPDAIEKIVGGKRLDPLELVEDELILSVPYIPRHSVCPGMQDKAAEAPEAPAARRPSPFAALEQLKRKS